MLVRKRERESEFVSERDREREGMRKDSVFSHLNVASNLMTVSLSHSLSLTLTVVGICGCRSSTKLVFKS